MDELLDRPAASAREPQAVRVTVTNADAPGLRQFLKRTPPAAPPTPSSPAVDPTPEPVSPHVIVTALFVADALLVLLSGLVLTGGFGWAAKGAAGVGMAAAAGLGVLAVTLLRRD